jgi:tetratricopeptide (TPR) repeat protein
MGYDSAAAPAPNDQDQIATVTRIVLQVLTTERNAVSVGNENKRSLFERIRTNWQILAVLSTVALAIVAWVKIGVDPLESAREIKYKKDQRDAQRKMAQTHISLGNDFLNVGQIEAASDEFENAKKLDPYNSEADFGLLKVSVFKPLAGGVDDDPEIAQRRINGILTQKADDTNALAFQGDVYSTMDSKKALDYYNRALESNGGNAWAYFGKGLLFDRSGKSNLALEMYEKAVQLSPWNQIFLNNLAYQRYLRGNYKDAELHYVFLLDLESRYLLSRCMLANTQLKLGAVSLAYSNLQPLNEYLRDDQVIKLRRNQGQWFFHVERGEIVELNSAAEKIAYSRYMMALASYMLGYRDEAYTHLAEAEAAGRDASTQARRVLKADISTLAKERPEWATGLLVFIAALEHKNK